MKPRKKHTPRLDRLYFDIPNSDGSYDKVLPWETYMQDYYYNNSPEFDTPEQRTLEKALKGNTYFDAGSIPEITVTPPKDNAVYKIKQIIPNKELRNSFYNNLYDDKDSSGFDYEDTFDRRMYINRLYELYNKSQKPTIRNTQSELFNTIPLLQKIGIMEGSSDRAHYSPFTNTLYVSPEFVMSDIEAELSHAYQVKGTDTPRSWNWMKQFLSVPNGDIKINGSSGYDRPGHFEFTAHKIIEPIFHNYLTDKKYQYEDAHNDINYVYNNPWQFYSLVKKGPFAGNIKNIKPLKRDK